MDLDVYYVQHCQIQIDINKQWHNPEMGIQAVNRAIDILSLFSARQPFLGIKEISTTMGLPKGTVHGLVRTLAQRGLLSQDPETQKYGLGLSIYEMGTTLSWSLKIYQVGAGPAYRLVETTRLGVRIAIWDQESALIILNVFHPSQTVPFDAVGPRIPAYCSAVGKAILAWLPEDEVEAYLDKNPLSRYTANTITDRGELLQNLKDARNRGVAVDREEYLMRFECIGAPIFDRTGRPTAAISVSGKPNLLLDGELPSVSDELIQTAKEISRYMGYVPEVAPLEVAPLKAAPKTGENRSGERT
jgi:IclR family KDG regulon transcriptional repressor